MHGRPPALIGFTPIRKNQTALRGLCAFVVQIPRVASTYLAVEETGHAATDVARHLGIRQTSVLKSVKKGKILCDRVGLQT